MKRLQATAIVLGLLALAVGLIVLESSVVRRDVERECARLQGRPVAEVDASFGPPATLWSEGRFACPETLVCSRTEWRGRAQRYERGIDWSVIAYFEGDTLTSCDLSGS